MTSRKKKDVSLFAEKRSKLNNFCGYVYFVQCEAYPRMVKIGWSKSHPSERLNDLQLGCPFCLTLLGYLRGSISDEGVMHVIFAKSRGAREWFHKTEEMVAFINKHCHSDCGERSAFFANINKEEIGRLSKEECFAPLRYIRQTPENNETKDEMFMKISIQDDFRFSVKSGYFLSHPL